MTMHRRCLATFLQVTLLTTFGILFQLSTATVLAQPSKSTQYKLSVKGHETDDHHVKVTVTTNIPGEIELMVEVGLANQKPNDVWIGKDGKLKVVNGAGETSLDVSALPRGEYDLEADFYPRWGFADDRSRATGITHNLESKQRLSIVGSGQSAEMVSRRKEGQKWVMSNVSMGMKWNPSNWLKRYGPWEQLPPTKNYNPKIIKNYYFKSIDMTLAVNTLKHQIVTWRMGKHGL